MLIDPDVIAKWLQTEFGATPYATRPGEWMFDCPFCEKDTGHHGHYMFNVEKGAGHCWRGFDPRCESGHSFLTFVAMYYNLDMDAAKKTIDKNFEGATDALTKMKRKVELLQRNVDTTKLRGIEINSTINWDMPQEAEDVCAQQTPGAQMAYKWLTEKRRIPNDIIHKLSPMWLPAKTSKRWRAYNRRAFFPVTSQGNSAWIAYNIGEVTKFRPKTMNPPKSVLSQMLFLYDLYTDSNKPVILVEGIFDALRLYLYGYAAVAVFGTNISIAQIRLLNDLPTSEVIVCLDADASGASDNESLSCKADHMAKKLIEDCAHSISLMRLPSGDPDDTPLDVFANLYDQRESVGSRVSKTNLLKDKLQQLRENYHG